jgi:hypothetical protein
MNERLKAEIDAYIKQAIKPLIEQLVKEGLNKREREDQGFLKQLIKKGN